MSISNLEEQALRNELRRSDERVRRLEGQMSTFIKNNSVATYHSSLLGLDYASAGHTGFTSSSDFTSHTGDATIHFLEGAIDHTAILNIGSNSHATIDTHLASTANPHTVRLDQLSAPTTDTSLTVADGDYVEFKHTGNWVSGSQFRIHQDTGNPAGGTLLDVWADDTNVTVAKFGDSTNGVQVSQAGALTATGTGTIIATGFTVADESTDTTCFPLFSTAATGNLSPKSAAGLTFNSSTDDLSATLIAGIANANLLDKTAAEEVSAEWTFSVGAQFNDDDTLTMGTGDDMVAHHNATDNMFESNIRTGGSDAIAEGDTGFKFVHNWNAADYTPTGTWKRWITEDRAAATMIWAMHDGTSEYEFAGIFPFVMAQRALGAEVPSLLFVNDDNTSKPWDAGFAVGCQNASDGKFTGMYMRDIAEGLDFHVDGAEIMGTFSQGMTCGGVGGFGNLFKFRSGTSDINFLLEPTAQDSATVPWIEAHNRPGSSDIDTPLAGSRIFYIEHSRSPGGGGDVGVLTVWPYTPIGGATHGCGIYADGLLTFDDSGTTQGDTSISYVSATPSLDFQVDGTTVLSLGTAVPGTYTPTNVTTDRAYDANSTTTAELADVLGTLIADLQTLGLVG